MTTEKSLWSAAEEGDAKATHEILSSSSNEIDALDSRQRTPLMIAASLSGNRGKDVVTELMSFGADASIRSAAGTALSVAVASGNAEIVGRIVSYPGVDPRTALEGDFADNAATRLAQQASKQTEFLLRKTKVGVKDDILHADGTVMGPLELEKALSERAGGDKSRLSQWRKTLFPALHPCEYECIAVEEPKDHGVVFERITGGEGILRWLVEENYDKVRDIIMKNGGIIEIEADGEERFVHGFAILEKVPGKKSLTKCRFTGKPFPILEASNVLELAKKAGLSVAVSAIKCALAEIQAQKRGIVPWRRSRLMICGQGRVGKTCFVARLKSPGALDKAARYAGSTKGVSVSSVEIGVQQDSDKLRQLGVDKALMEANENGDWSVIDKVGQEYRAATMAYANSVVQLEQLMTITSLSESERRESYFSTMTRSALSRTELAITVGEDELTRTRDMSSSSQKLRKAVRALRALDKFWTQIKPEVVERDTVPPKRRWSFSRSKLRLRISLWDFGGQEVFHTVHHKFLTRKGVYAVLFKLPDWKVSAEARRHVEFWFRSISCHAKGAPIVVVATHSRDSTDSEGDFLRVNQEVMELAKACDVYDTIVHAHGENAVWVVDSVEDDDGIFLRLRRSIEAVIEADKDGYIKRAVPIEWLEAVDQLEKERFESGVVTATVDQIQDLVRQLRSRKKGQNIYDCPRDGCEKTEARALLYLLDNLGVVTYFGKCVAKNSILRQLVVLDPQWIVDLLTSVIRDFELHKLKRDLDCMYGSNDAGYEEAEGVELWHNLCAYGLLDVRMLKNLWPPEDCDENQRAFLLQLMLELRLLAPYAEENDSREVYVIPSLLPDDSITRIVSLDQPSSPRNRKKPLFACNFAFLPSGLFGKFLAKVITAPETVVRSRTDLQRRQATLFVKSCRIELFEEEKAIGFGFDDENAISLMQQRLMPDLQEVLRLFYSESLFNAPERLDTSKVGRVKIAVESADGEEETDDDDENQYLGGGKEGGDGERRNVKWAQHQVHTFEALAREKFGNNATEKWLTNSCGFNKRQTEIAAHGLKAVGQIGSNLNFQGADGGKRLTEDIVKLGVGQDIAEKIANMLKGHVYVEDEMRILAYYCPADYSDNVKESEIERELELFRLDMDVLGKNAGEVVDVMCESWRGTCNGDRIRSMLRNKGYEVLHVVAHNNLDEDGECTSPLFLGDASGESLATCGCCNALGERDHCIFLNACFTTHPALKFDMSGSHRWVVAWKGKVHIAAANSFCQGFYRKLLHGKPSDEFLKGETEYQGWFLESENNRFVLAFAAGCVQRKQWYRHLKKRKKGGTPVLFHDGRLRCEYPSDDDKPKFVEKKMFQCATRLRDDKLDYYDESLLIDMEGDEAHDGESYESCSGVSREMISALNATLEKFRYLKRVPDCIHKSAAKFLEAKRLLVKAANQNGFDPKPTLGKYYRAIIEADNALDKVIWRNTGQVNFCTSQDDVRDLDRCRRDLAAIMDEIMEPVYKDEVHRELLMRPLLRAASANNFLRSSAAPQLRTQANS